MIPRRVLPSFLRYSSGNFALLLMSLVGFLLCAPMVQDRLGGRILLEILLSLIFVGAVFTLSEREREFIPASIYVVVWLLVRLLARMQKEAGLLLFASETLTLVFLGVAVVWILRHVLKDEKITTNKIAGAVCAYFLLGLAWASLYLILLPMKGGLFELPPMVNVDPTKAIAVRDWEFSKMIYYSFVTLTTLGYGDIVPKWSPATTLAWLEALTGQLYLAVLIARLVGLQIAHTLSGKGDGGPSGGSGPGDSG